MIEFIILFVVCVVGYTLLRLWYIIKKANKEIKHESTKDSTKHKFK